MVYRKNCYHKPMLTVDRKNLKASLQTPKRRLQVTELIYITQNFRNFTIFRNFVITSNLSKYDSYLTNA